MAYNGRKDVMVLKILIIIVCVWLLFELIEHAVVPLLWLILKKNRRPKTGAEGMIGEIGEVKEWSGTEGKIFVHGELWQATSEAPLAAGEKVEVLNVHGLTLIVRPRNF
jgi:membrane-bound ClpP family serine protease